MLHTDNWRHQNVDLMPMDFESVVTKELSNTIVRLHNLGLRFLITTDDNNGSVISEHHLKIIKLLLVTVKAGLVFFGDGLGSRHDVGFH